MTKIQRPLVNIKVRVYQYTPFSLCVCNRACLQSLCHKISISFYFKVVHGDPTVHPAESVIQAALQGVTNWMDLVYARLHILTFFVPKVNVSSKLQFANYCLNYLWCFFCNIWGFVCYNYKIIIL